MLASPAAAADTRLEVKVVDEGVALLGPDGVIAVLPQEAAAAVGRRLLQAADDQADIYQKPLG